MSKRDKTMDAPGQAGVRASAYKGWDKHVAEEGRRIAQRVRERTKAFVIDTGRDLTGIKTKLAHGQFEIWVEGVLGMNVRTAQNYMAAFKAFGNKSEMI